jgi:1,2-dihydroxy-3-keto-5-methylthiopentene dioxygenase
MAVLNLVSDNRTITDEHDIRNALLSHGIDYERWTPEHELEPDATTEDVLKAYSREIDALKTRGGYVTADVIDVNPDTPGLEEMLSKFNREHWHDEDEVRFIICGHGLFHIHGDNGIVAIEVGPGDLIRVPRGTKHWFNLCADRRIRAIRLFQDVSGWTPHYTDSKIDAQYQPLCFGAPPLGVGTVTR